MATEYTDGDIIADSFMAELEADNVFKNDFSVDEDGWFGQTGGTVSYASGVVSFDCSTGFVQRNNVHTPLMEFPTGTTYTVVIDVDTFTSGSCRVEFDAGAAGKDLSEFFSTPGRHYLEITRTTGPYTTGALSIRGDGVFSISRFEILVENGSYIFNNLSMSLPTVQAERNGTDGRLVAKATRRDIRRMAGNCEVQIPRSIENRSLINAVFDVPAEANNLGIDIRVVIEEESQSTVANESRTRSLNVRAIVPDALVVEGAGTTAANGIYERNGTVNDVAAYTLYDGETEEYSLVGSLGSDGFLVSGTPSSANPNIYETSMVGTPADQYPETGWIVADGTAPAPTLRRAVWTDFI